MTTNNWPLVKVISGGQTGADLAGLRAAKALGYQTGGWMPHDFKAEDGNHPEYAGLYGCVAIEGGGYPERTRANVLDSSGTLIAIEDPSSPGVSLTIRCCRVFKRPRLLWFGPGDLNVEEKPENDPPALREWIITMKIRTLNVAGHRESTHPGIGAAVEKLLLEALAR